MLGPPEELTATGRNARLFAWLNRLLRYTKQNQILSGVGYTRNHTPNGFTLALEPTRGGSSGTKQFIVKGVRNDYLQCLPYTSAADANSITIPADVALDPPDASLIKIAKPPELRAYDFDGLTWDGWSYVVVVTSPFLGIRRHATRVSDGKKEIQEVVPHYLKNWVIYADQPVGGTNAYDADDNPIAWMDTNRAGRIFCKTTARITEDADF